MEVHLADTSEARGDRQPSFALRPADGVFFFLFCDQKAIFSEPAQEIYALNDTAAYIWCRVEEHATADSICKELTISGVSPDRAKKYLDQALHNWRKLGLLEENCDLGSQPIYVERTFNISIAGFNATVRVATERLARSLTLFDHQIMPVENCGHVFDVGEADGLVHVFHNKRHVICCDAIELAPAIKAYLTELIVALSPPNVVFHSACLVRGEKSLLISGRPGAGKSTLALRLVEAGFEYSTDDIVLLAPDGRAMGVPFAPAVKPGAWDIVNQFRPDLKGAIVHRRPDGKRVRYLKPNRIARSGGISVGWIIFIRRTGGPTRLKPLGQIEVMRRLMEGSYSPGGRLNLAMCKALKQMVAHAESFELIYSDLADANHAIVCLCNG
jgi:Coenzyme PQQ synthesis protein D (PqqD)